MSYDLQCPKCGRVGKGEWHQPAFDEKYYQCSCGLWWHPELLESAKSEPKKCKWTLDEPEWNNWNTTCGECFQLQHGTPEDNHMKYCCYCGEEIEQVGDK